jgi:hypothetical protein
MRTAVDTRAAHARAEQILAAERLRAPATKANTVRNARAEIDRCARWAPARDALWQLLDTRSGSCSTRTCITTLASRSSAPATQTTSHSHKSPAARAK